MANISSINGNPIVVGASGISDGSVGTAKIANGSVTQAKLGNDVTFDVGDNSITDNKLKNTGVKGIAESMVPYSVPLTFSEGFITTSGAIHEQSGAVAAEMYTNEYIDIAPNDKIRIVLANGGTVGVRWVKLALYNRAKEFMMRIDVSMVGESLFAVGEWENTYQNQNGFFARLTFQSGPSSDWRFIVTKYPRADLVDESINNAALALSSTNGLLEEIDVDSYSYVPTALVGRVIDLEPVDAIGYDCKIVQCTEGDRFTITGVGGGSAALLWCFVDSTGLVLTESSANVSAHGSLIEAPSGASHLVVNFSHLKYHKLLRGFSGESVYNGTVVTSTGSRNSYINVGNNETVSLTPVAYMGSTWAIYPCSAGERFTLYGCGGGAARLWAFVNDANKVMSRSKEGDVAVGDVIVAPDYATKLIVNSVNGDMLCYRNSASALSSQVRAALIPMPQIHDMPKDVVAMPTVTHSSVVEQVYGTSVAKSAIYKNGEWFCITYGENVHGTGTDIPYIGDDGMLEMKYKHFRLVNGEMSDVTYGTLAKIGDTYKDYNGNSAVMAGGAGLPSGVGNMQYFTTPYSVQGNDPSYTFAGIANYGFTPCCCTVNVTSGGVSFGEIKELTLTVGNVVGKFDMHRVDPDFRNSITYMTTAAPCRQGPNWWWAQPVTFGFALLHSTNGIDWTYRYTVHTQYQPKDEITISSNGLTHLLLALRTNEKSEYVGDFVYVMALDWTKGQIISHHRLPFVESRTQIVRTGDEWLFLYSPDDKAVTDCLRICRYSNATMAFWRWFTIYKKATWYVTCYHDSVADTNFEKMYLCGGNSSAGSTGGLTFLELTFDDELPHSPLDIPAMVI